MPQSNLQARRTVGSIAIATLFLLSFFLNKWAVTRTNNSLALIPAAGETYVSDNDHVDADDPAIWADPDDPSRGLIFATDKTLGLYVHNLDGSMRQFFPSGPLDNVDLRAGFIVNGKSQVLVAASERKQFGIKTYLLDPASLTTRLWGFIPTDEEFGEPYGFCMGRRGEDFYLVVNNKAGVIEQIRIEAGVHGLATKLVRKLKLHSQTEGCVVDDAAQMLYVGEEDVAIWQFPFDPQAKPVPTKVAKVDGQRLTADIEGLAIMRDRGINYLIASSQGDSTFATYRIDNNQLIYIGRFRVVDSKVTDGVTATDGVDAWSGPIGKFSEGLIVVHDDADDSVKGQQNFKLIDWRTVKSALGI